MNRVSLALDSSPLFLVSDSIVVRESFKLLFLDENPLGHTLPPPLPLPNPVPDPFYRCYYCHHRRHLEIFYAGIVMNVLLKPL